MEKIIIIHFCVQLFFAIIYILWQFNVVHFSDSAMVRIISALGLFETCVLILTRFIHVSGKALLCLGGFYVIQLVLLVMQFIMADWGFGQKIKDVLFMLFYVILFMTDILYFDWITFFKSVDISVLVSIDLFLKNSWIGDVLKAVIIAICKGCFDLYGLKKGVSY